MKTELKKTGFTLVELLVAMSVTAIVLGAAAGITFAWSSANSNGDKDFSSMAKVRYINLKISELIRNSKLVCSYNNGNIILWHTDKNNDNKINANELVILDKGNFGSKLSIVTCSETYPVSLYDITNKNITAYMYQSMNSTVTRVLENSRNVQFYFNRWPPYTERVGLSFELNNGGWQRYQFKTALRSDCTNLLNDHGTAIVSDDDR